MRLREINDRERKGGGGALARALVWLIFGEKIKRLWTDYTNCRLCARFSARREKSKN